MSSRSLRDAIYRPHLHTAVSDYSTMENFFPGPIELVGSRAQQADGVATHRTATAASTDVRSSISDSGSGNTVSTFWQAGINEDGVLRMEDDGSVSL